MTAKFLAIVFLLIVSFAASANDGKLVPDPVQELTSSIDSFLHAPSFSSEKMKRLERKLQTLNWNNYYGQFSGKGPVKQLMEYCHEHKLVTGEIACLNGLGVMFRQVGKPSDAEEMHLSALALARETNDTLAMLISLNNLGVNARRIDDLKKATNYHMEVLNLADKSSVKTGIVKKSTCIALNSLGNINISLKQYSKAIDIFKQSNEIERSENSVIGQAINHANIGEAYELSGQIDSAQVYYEESLAFNQQVGSLLGIALCNYNLGNICLKKKRLDEAQRYFERGIDLIRPTGDKYHLCVMLEGAARERIEARQYIYAKILLAEAIDLAKAINGKGLLKDGYHQLSQICHYTGDYHQAIDYLTLSHTYSDSIFNDENQRHLTEIQTRYETEKKEQQIVLLNKEQELNRKQMQVQRLFLWGLAILSVLVFVVILLIYRQKQVQAKNREIELSQKLLRSQMNPHFVFNSLGAIQHYMMKNDGRKAAFYLSSFSSLMRAILKNSREELITLAEETQTLGDYLNLHKLRLGDKLGYSVTIAEELDQKMILLPPMLVQPFVENAIIHGVEKVEENGRLAISFQKDGDFLVVTVDDNGPGVQEKGPNTKDHVSYALQIFKERAEVLKKAFGIELSYVIRRKADLQDDEPGTVVVVKLTLMKG